MLKYIGKRLLMMIPVILGISFIIFAIMDLTRETQPEWYWRRGHTRGCGTETRRDGP